MVLKGIQKFIFGFIAILFLMSSCQQNRNRKWLDAAYSYIYYKTDSVHFYLNKIKNPDKLSEQEKNLYHYISGIASIHIWNYPNPAHQELEQAIRVFMQENDSSKVAHGMWELAMYFQTTGDFEKADTLFKEGIQYTTNTDQRITYLRPLSFNHLYRRNIQEALKYNEQQIAEISPGSLRRELIAMGDRAEIYQHSDLTDSAFFYFDKALRLAHEQAYYPYVAYYHKKRSELYSQSGNAQQAFIELQKSNEYDKNRHSKPHYLFLKAKIHIAIGELDSAIYYLQKVLQTPDKYVAARAYEYLSNVYHLQSKDSLALATLHLYNTHFDKTNENVSNAIRYKEDLLKFENKELKLLKKQRELIILLISCFAILICFLIYIIYIKEKKKKQEKEEELTKERLENQVKRLQQEKEVSILQERTAELREQIFRQLSVSQKIPSLSKEKNSNQEYKSKLTADELKELIETVNTIWPGFSQRLKKNYPELREKDIAFCCLIKCGITTKDLSNIYYVTPSAISQKKNRMKKEKFEITDESLTLDEILKEI